MISEDSFYKSWLQKPKRYCVDCGREESYADYNYCRDCNCGSGKGFKEIDSEQKEQEERGKR